MPTQIDDLIKQTDAAIEEFNKGIPRIEAGIFAQIELLVKELDLTDGNIDNSIRNLRILGQIQNLINRAVLTQPYIKSVQEFMKSYDTVANIQDKYFKSIEQSYTTPEILTEIKKQSIDSVVHYLTEDGIRANISDKIADILRVNITSGGSYSDLTSQLREFIRGGQGDVGALQKYAGQIVTDSLNQFSGTYMQTVSESLGFKWYMYVGSNLKTTRQTCLLLTKKAYYYYLELPDIIHGDIDGVQVPLGRNGLPHGMIPGTTVDNFQVYRMGYNCGHQAVPTHESFIPIKVRIETYDRLGIPHTNGVAD